MLSYTKNHKPIIVEKFQPAYVDELLQYLHALSETTVKRFGPHRFEKDVILSLFQHSQNYIGYIARDAETRNIIAYAIIKVGFLDHDAARLRSYGLELSNETDCTFAPSVADAWQGTGVGNILFSCMANELRQQHFKRIILWGGVQKNNDRAVHYYMRLGFTVVGEFEYYGQNLDMVMYI